MDSRHQMPRLAERSARSPMLTRFRIEVEEQTADECVSALANYEQALVDDELRRYALLDADMANSDDELYLRAAAELLGREVTEEVISFDETIPGYRGRRVVHFRRVDGRESAVAA